MSCEFEMHPDAPILVTFCASTKEDYGKDVPAWQLFSGPRWSIIRELSVDVLEHHVYVLSGYFGISGADEKWPMYSMGSVLTAEFLKSYNEINAILDDLLTTRKNPIHFSLQKDWLELVDDSILTNPKCVVYGGSLGALTSGVKETVNLIKTFYPDHTVSAKQVLLSREAPKHTPEVFSLMSFAGYEIFTAISAEGDIEGLTRGLPPILRGILEEPNYSVYHRLKEA